MEILYRDLTGHYRHPPEIEELVGELEDCRGRKKHCEVLIIIPSYHDNRRLSKMVKALEKIQSKIFDVAVIYAKEDRFVKSNKIRILQLRRREDFGFAGAVYLGQKIALRDSYRYFLVTDVDLLPYGSDPVKALYQKAEKEGLDYVSGLQHGLKSRTTYTLWGLIRTSALEKSGFFALPLYLGLDEGEFHYRLIKSGARLGLLDRPVSKNLMSSEQYVTFEQKLSILAQQGGNDTLYYNSDMIANWKMPQIFFDPALVPKEYQSEPLRWSVCFSQNLSFAARRFFSQSLLRRLMEERIPESKKYAQRIRATQFSVYSWQPQQPLCKVEWFSGSNRPSAESLDGLQALFSAIANSRSERLEKNFYFLMYDFCKIYDPKAGRAGSFEWKSRLSAPKKLACVILSLLDTAVLFCVGISNIISGRNLFAGYGLRQAQTR